MKKKLFSLMLIIYCFLSMTSYSSCSEWINLGENYLGDFLYDKTSVKQTENGLIIVSWKTIISPNKARFAESLSP